MNPILRGSAAHVFVDSLEDPQISSGDDHHLRRVLRIRDSDVVTVSDGAGRWTTGRLTASGLTLESEPMVVPPPPAASVLCAIPKGDRPEWIVQKLTEIGATSIGFVECARSVVRWDDARAHRHVDRLRRVAREASMQSRRVWLPEVHDVLPFDEAIKPISCAITDPEGEGLPPTIDTLIVGPEGGFTDREVDMSSIRVRLSENVLRVETAALAAAFLLTERHGLA